jgi:ATP-dependent DNA helicase HFM1/MER3
MNSSRRRSNDTGRSIGVDSFEDEDLQDDDLIAAGILDSLFLNTSLLILSAAADADWFGLSHQLPPPSRRNLHLVHVKQEKTESNDQEEPIRLANGRWKCNHKCKDKTAFVP